VRGDGCIPGPNGIRFLNLDTDICVNDFVRHQPFYAVCVLNLASVAVFLADKTYYIHSTSCMKLDGRTRVVRYSGHPPMARCYSSMSCSQPFPFGRRVWCVGCMKNKNTQQGRLYATLTNVNITVLGRITWRARLSHRAQHGAVYKRLTVL
jgi:hypothetical protein